MESEPSTTSSASDSLEFQNRISNVNEEIGFSIKVSMMSNKPVHIYQIYAEPLKQIRLLEKSGSSLIRWPEAVSEAIDLGESIAKEVMQQNVFEWTRPCVPKFLATQEYSKCYLALARLDHELWQLESLSDEDRAALRQQYDKCPRFVAQCRFRTNMFEKFMWLEQDQRDVSWNRR